MAQDPKEDKRGEGARDSPRTSRATLEMPVLTGPDRACREELSGESERANPGYIEMHTFHCCQEVRAEANS